MQCILNIICISVHSLCGDFEIAHVEKSKVSVLTLSPHMLSASRDEPRHQLSNQGLSPVLTTIVHLETLSIPNNTQQCRLAVVSGKGT